ncbi:hypothetical protein G3578_16845 [Brevibacillus sp. SYP-B805]|uniref:hypothetical protein n=1 Tax=Brevibacillus sp. SYP-B805 TaxID=1578199 RepID=UPI0013EA652B|nr:hypothetical protein [Brevibacillus sp. SYP-B805]NGQ96835.1 hypothetical protein [Brevibacillus sp. SYP-B805]
MKPFVCYLAWQEDDWLDEVLDYFPQVNATVPTAKAWAAVTEERMRAGLERALVILNVAGEKEKSMAFLQRLQAEGAFADDPLYLVGVAPEEAEEWQQRFPRASVIVITGHPFEFDYEAVFRQMEAALEGAS